MAKLTNVLFFLYTSTIVFQNFDGLSLGGNSIPKILSLVLFLLLIYQFKVPNSSFLKIIVLPLLLFCAAITVVSFSFEYQDLEWTIKLTTIYQNIVFFWLTTAYLTLNPDTLKNLFLGFSVGVVTSSFLFLFNLGVSEESGRLVIFGENSNTLGIYGTFTFLYIVNAFFDNDFSKGYYRYLILTPLPILLNIIALSGSRISFIGFSAAMLLYFLLKGGKDFGNSLIIKLVGFVVVLLLINYILSFDIMQERINSTVEDGNVSGRDRIWSSVIPYILEHPFLGIGITGYTSVTTMYFGSFFSPHNVFVEIFAYSGFVGLALYFFGFYFRILYFSFRIYLGWKYSLPLIYMIFIFLIFTTGQGLSDKLFWLIYSYIFAGYFFMKNYKSEEETQIEVA